MFLAEGAEGKQDLGFRKIIFFMCGYTLMWANAYYAVFNIAENCNSMAL